MTDVVVPDAIEPVVGWRAYRFTDGMLWSPQQNMPWKAGARAQAHCSQSPWDCRWESMTPERRLEMEEMAVKTGFTAEIGHSVKFLMPTGEIEVVPVYMPFGMMGRLLPPIKHYPPEGEEWVLVVRTLGHPAPHEDCHCGIHIAKDLRLALQYQPSRVGLFARVQGWGKVIPAHGGYRVQYAYPETLFVGGSWKRIGPRLKEWSVDAIPGLEAYGVPVLGADECPHWWELDEDDIDIG